MVEVLPGRHLFALLGGSEQRFLAAAKGRLPGRRRVEWLQEIPDQTEPVNLLPDRVPMLVTFDDIAEPKSVREVDPGDLVAVSGEGVRLKAVTLEITREAVTERRVEGVQGWLGPYPEAPIIPILDVSISAFRPNFDRATLSVGHDAALQESGTL